jgi:hypothetical protein
MWKHARGDGDEAAHQAHQAAKENHQRAAALEERQGVIQVLL